jgi:hypothetical protein
MSPLPGDHGAHGRFDAAAKPSSLLFLASRHRAGIAVAALTLLVAVILLTLLSGR